jgi:tRNA dimethylallyltransferase
MAPDGMHRESSPPAHPVESSTLACPAGDAARPAAPCLGGDCWILSGPTAAGKTALALDLARRLDAEIVSVDSMAVYQGLDIGTAKPSPSERARVEHHVIDVVPPSEPYSVARWLADAAAAVETIRSRGRQILFVGGTPLYLRALRDGLAPLPADDPVFRRGLLEEIEVHGSAALHSRLATIDPAAAARIHPNDVKRIVRALEVSHATGRPLSDAFAPVADPIFESRMMIVDLPRRLLVDRIDRRVDAMFAAGLIDEVRRADASGGLGPTARQAAGYAECLDLLAGRVPLAEAVRLTKQRTRQLAKRQLTWLRSFKGAVWITA